MHWKDNDYLLKLANKRIKKLTAKIVKEIRRRYCAGEIKYKEIALEYEISIGCVGNIINNKTWIDEKYDIELARKITKNNIKSSRFK